MLETARRTQIVAKRSPGGTLGCLLPLAVTVVLALGGFILSLQGVINSDQLGIAFWLAAVVPSLYVALVWLKPAQLLWAAATFIILVGLVVGALALVGVDFTPVLALLTAVAALAVFGGSTWLGVRSFLITFGTVIVFVAVCYSLCLVIYLLNQAGTPQP